MGNTQQCKYARFIPGTKEEGYSDHLVSWVNENPKELTGPIDPQCPTVIHAFKNTAKKFGSHNFLGRRDDTKEGRPYVWMTWSEADTFTVDMARGIKALNLMPEIQAEGSTWKFMGVYAKNRPEWVLTDLAAASIGGTVIAFYDTLGPQAVEFVINQTELTTITCAGGYLEKLILLKSQGKVKSI